MKVWILALTLVTQLAWAAPNEVHHPAPKQPIFLSEVLYKTMTPALKPIPSAGSPELIADYGELIYLQNTRTEAQCAAAKKEVLVSLESFFGGEQSILSRADIQRLAPFFEQVRNDADFFIQKLKVDLPRPRPFKYIPELKPCVPLEVTMSYPSGHATLAELFSLILADIYPAKKEQLFARAKQIGTNRILAGMHHRSDVSAGQELGRLLYAHFKKNQAFKDSVSKL
ncbi:MAG TPA: phosphatase PAP2 family protein [Bdellovibrionota bacterium]|jgi:acid phosphatase (class A)|nr:phosphatase PAP2 family protein [Bdellovibrionota bacterium]